MSNNYEFYVFILVNKKIKEVDYEGIFLRMAPLWVSSHLIAKRRAFCL